MPRDKLKKKLRHYKLFAEVSISFCCLFVLDEYSFLAGENMLTPVDGNLGQYCIKTDPLQIFSCCFIDHLF